MYKKQTIRHIVLDEKFLDQYFKLGAGLQRQIDFTLENIQFEAKANELFPPTWLEIEELTSNIVKINVACGDSQLLIIAIILQNENLLICECLLEPSFEELLAAQDYTESLQNDDK